MNKYPLIQELLAEKTHEHIIQILQARFGEVPQELVKRIRRIRKEERLDNLHRFSAICSDLEAFKAQLKA